MFLANVYFILLFHFYYFIVSIYLFIYLFILFLQVFQDAKEWLITKGTPESTAVALATQKQAQLVYLTDPNGNTPLSEAASGGHTDCIQLLIDKGSDTNTKGQFERTPIYRAAFAGHVEAVQVGVVWLS